MADYLRQRAVHLSQDAYRIRSTKKGELLDSRRINQLGKSFDVEEVDRLRDEVLRLHGSEASFARHVAAKILPAAVKLLEAIRALHALPPM